MFISLWACGENEEQSERQKKRSEKSNVVDVQDSVQLPTNSQEMLPSPLQVAILFKESGLDFNGEDLLDLSLVDDASSELHQLLLLGAYSSDLALASLHSEKAKAIDRLQVVSNLSLTLGFGTRFNSKENLEKFEKNIDNVDSTAHFIASMEYDIEEYIHNNDEQDRSTIIFCGAWLQSLELGRRNLSEMMNEDVVYLLLDQQQIAALIELMLSRIDDYDQVPEFTLLKEVVANIKTSLDRFDLSDIENIEISRDDFNTLLKSIQEAHQSIYTP